MKTNVDKYSKIKRETVIKIRIAEQLIAASDEVHTEESIQKILNKVETYFVFFSGEDTGIIFDHDGQRAWEFNYARFNLELSYMDYDTAFNFVAND